MRCPSCGHEIADEAAAFCSRCGTALAASEGRATETVDVGEAGATDEIGSTGVGAAPDTREVDAPLPGATTEEAGHASEGPVPQTDAGAGARAASSPSSLASSMRRVRDSEVVVRGRRALLAGGWVDAAQAAGVAFLGVLVIGAALLLALKLHFPELGAGFNPISVLAAIVMAGLGTLGVPLHIGGIEISTVPLGALLASGAVIAWATSSALRERERDVAPLWLEGAKVAVPFALLCWLAALIFRIRAGPNPVASGGAEALVFPALWAALFGALGGARVRGTVRAVTGRILDRVRARWPDLYEGFAAGGVMLVVVAVLSAFALLLWVIIGLARGATPKGFTAGDAVAAVVYAVAFLPNVIVTIAGLSLGAPVEIGSQITGAGRLRGSVPMYSIFDWDGAGPPFYVALLLMIPVIACSIGGYIAYKSADDRSKYAEIIGAAAATFAGVLFVLAALSEARLGAGLLGRGGFARLALDAPITFVLAFLWAALLGFAGWKVAELQVGRGRAST